MNKIIKNALILAAITLIAGLLLGAAHQVTVVVGDDRVGLRILFQMVPDRCEGGIHILRRGGVLQRNRHWLPVFIFMQR